MSVIVRMQFVPHIGFRDRGTKLNSYADILTVQGLLVQVKCNEEQYMAALNYLSKETV